MRKFFNNIFFVILLLSLLGFSTMSAPQPVKNETLELDVFTEVQDWLNLEATNHPSVRYLYSLLYDNANQMIIGFGGQEGGLGESNATFTFDVDTNTWSFLNPTLAPDKRRSYDMVYVDSIEKFVLFGGDNSIADQYYNDTWTYDAASNVWTKLNPSSAPSPRFGHHMVYDKKLDRVYLLNGYHTRGNLETIDDMWEFNPQTEEWTEITKPANLVLDEIPLLFEYDSINNVSILVNHVPLGDWETWSYNGTSDVWTQLSVNFTPEIYARNAAAFDNSTGTVLVYGNTLAANTTWIFDYANLMWEQGPDGPLGLEAASMTYDPVNNMTILYGGTNNDGHQRETLAYQWMNGSLRTITNTETYVETTVQTETEVKTTTEVETTTEGGVFTDTVEQTNTILQTETTVITNQKSEASLHFGIVFIAISVSFLIFKRQRRHN